MIKNGWIKAENGQWINLNQIKYFCIKSLINHNNEVIVYMIIAVIEGDEITIADFKEREKAQEYLDEMMWME